MKNILLFYVFIFCSLYVRAGSGSGTGSGTGTGTGSGKSANSSRSSTITSTQLISDVKTNPENFRKLVDTDHDGKLSQQEIMVAIDSYFDGNPNCDYKSIIQLISDFFDGR